MSYKCPVCGHLIDGVFDSCAVCEWEFNGIEESLTEEEQQDARETSNPMSLYEARKLYAQGKDVYGELLITKK